MITLLQSMPVDFAGPWVGQTQGHAMRAHMWEIRQLGDTLWITTFWEGEARPSYANMRAKLVPGQAAFELGDGFVATLVDAQHFIVPGWCTNDERDGVGDNYDVVFSRPGIAELMARVVYERHRSGLEATKTWNEGASVD